MSGGRLVVMDRAGRDVKQFPLAEGLATLGSDPACDIIFLLRTVSPHHATVVVHNMQTVVHSVSERETLVNGSRVSVAALRHGDVISLGGRHLRWEYTDLTRKRPLEPEPELHRRVHRARTTRRCSEPPPKAVIVTSHRASMPAATSERQVAVVQAQRRDRSDLNDTAASLPPNKRPRISKNGNSVTETVETNGDKTRRKVCSQRNTLAKLSKPTKASLWIESRKSSPRKSIIKPQTPVKSSAKTLVKSPAKTPRESSVIMRVRTPRKTPDSAPIKEKSPEKTPVKTPEKSDKEIPINRHSRKVVSAKKSTPLRMVVLKKAQNAHKMRVTKIQAPLKMDSTKQAAIMLMTRHTPKSKQPSPQQGNKGPSLVVKKPSIVRNTPRQAQKRSSARRISKTTPKRSSLGQNKSAGSKYDSLSDSETSLRHSNVTRRSGSRSSTVTPLPPSPKKSALKDPTAKKSHRKTESIKFDLSNLEKTAENRSSDVMLVDVTPENISDNSETELTLRYSDTSSDKSPFARDSLRSRSDHPMLEKYENSNFTEHPEIERRSGRTSSPRVPKSPRGINMIKRALETSDITDISSYSRRATKIMNTSHSSASAHVERSLSSRTSRNNLESYSIVDLVSVDGDSYSNKSGSVYNSAGSVSSNTTYDTPLLGSSTPYSKMNSTSVFEEQLSIGRTRSRALVGAAIRNGKSSVTSDIITTPENTKDATKTLTFNSTRVSRASKSRSRINDSDLQMNEEKEEDSSSKSFKRLGKVNKSSPLIRKNISVNETPSSKSDSPSSVGLHTPVNRLSPVEASTPVLNIQSLLDASQNSQKSPNKRNLKRKTIGVVRSEPKSKLKSKSLNIERSLRGRDISVNFDGSGDNANNNEGVITPTSAVKLVPEGVKNKHSTAKMPKSKRSLIDNLDESDIVKQLFNSPVKRKLSQSMTEFSRKQLSEDQEERPTRFTRSSLAFGGTPDNSITEHTEASEVITPGVFVSPLSTPCNSPNMAGIKRLFQKCTPDNDIRNVKSVKGLMRTPRTRKCIKNDLTKLEQYRGLFARSPRICLSDVRVNLFAASPKNDLRRVSGVKALFQSQKKQRKSPRNELDDIRGVRTLFKRTGNSPRNDLSNVRGIKQMFREQKIRNDLSDVSGVEQLFHESDNLDTTFDQLMGRRPVRGTYVRAKSFTTNEADKRKYKKLVSKSLPDSISQITNNVQECVEKEVRNSVQKEVVSEASTSKRIKSTPNKSQNVSNIILSRELQKLATDTVDGNGPVLDSRTRNCSVLLNKEINISSQKKSASELYSAHTLPIKKRAVVHSTLVKSHVNNTLNASEIVRMSPISSADKTSEVTITRPPPLAEMSPKIKQSPKNNVITVKLEENLKPSPKITRPIRASRIRRMTTVNEKQKVPNSKKRRLSLVINKKALSAQPAPRATRRGKVNIEEKQELVEASPKKTRSKRGQRSQVSVETKMRTPKRNTKAKVSQTSVIVVKPSPKQKPRTTRRTTNIKKTESSENEQIQQEKKHKIVITQPKSLETREKAKSLQDLPVAVEPARKTSKTKAVVVIKDKSKSTVSDISTLEETRRTHNSDKKETKNVQFNIALDTTEHKAIERKTAGLRGKNIEPQANLESERSRRSCRVKADNTISPEIKISIGRRRKTVQEELPPKTISRSRKTQAISSVTNNETNKTKVQQFAPRPNTGRGRKRKNTEPEETITTENETKQNKEKKLNKSGIEVKNNSKNASGDAGKQEQKTSVKTRARTRKVTQEDKKPVTGKKVAVVVEATQVGGRKKRTNVEISDAEGTVKAGAGGCTRRR